MDAGPAIGGAFVLPTTKWGGDRCTSLLPWAVSSQQLQGDFEHKLTISSLRRGVPAVPSGGTLLVGFTVGGRPDSRGGRAGSRR